MYGLSALPRLIKKINHEKNFPDGHRLHFFHAADGTKKEQAVSSTTSSSATTGSNCSATSAA